MSFIADAKKYYLKIYWNELP